MDGHMYTDLTGYLWWYFDRTVYSDFATVQLGNSLVLAGLTECPPAKWEVWEDKESEPCCTCGAAHTEFNTLHSTWCDIR